MFGQRNHSLKKNVTYLYKILVPLIYKGSFLPLIFQKKDEEGFIVQVEVIYIKSKTSKILIIMKFKVIN